MTDSESRIQNLEQTVHTIDKRQESFETFVRAYIDSNEKNISEMKADMREIKGQISNLSNQFHNAMIAGGIGLATILAGMVGVVVALITALKP